MVQKLLIQQENEEGGEVVRGQEGEEGEEDEKLRGFR